MGSFVKKVHVFFFLNLPQDFKGAMRLSPCAFLGGSMLGSDPIRSEIIEIRFTQVQKTITEDGRSVVAAFRFFLAILFLRPQPVGHPQWWWLFSEISPRWHYIIQVKDFWWIAQIGFCSKVHIIWLKMSRWSKAWYWLPRCPFGWKEVRINALWINGLKNRINGWWINGFKKKTVYPIL